MSDWCDCRSAHLAGDMAPRLWKCDEHGRAGFAAEMQSIQRAARFFSISYDEAWDLAYEVLIICQMACKRLGRVFYCEDRFLSVLDRYWGMYADGVALNTIRDNPGLLLFEIPLREPKMIPILVPDPPKVYEPLRKPCKWWQLHKWIRSVDLEGFQRRTCSRCFRSEKLLPAMGPYDMPSWYEVKK